MGTRRLRIVLASVLLVSMSAGAASAQARPEGQLTIAFDVSIGPAFFDPADTPGIATRFVFAPIFDPATLHGIGPRVGEPAVGLNSLLYFAAPYEEMRLKKDAR
jgi:hypothetical protein